MKDRRSYTNKVPDEVGYYTHKYISPLNGSLRTRKVFVGYVDHSKPKMQGRDKLYLAQKLRCCGRSNVLSSESLTPQEYEGWWKKDER